MNAFQGDLTDVSAHKALLAAASAPTLSGNVGTADTIAPVVLLQTKYRLVHPENYIF